MEDMERGDMLPAEPARVLFVCLGNICRSPLAEGAMRFVVAERCLEIEVDSAGTGAWHVGNPPDRRAQAVARRYGIDISGLRARQVRVDDFYRFTHIVALDGQNLRNLRALAPRDGVARLSLLLDHVPGREGQDVADPYYGDEEGFETAWADARAGAEGLIEALGRGS